jgi:energy-coupling factor transport system ATP-binding protein
MEIVKAKNLIFSYPDAAAPALSGVDLTLNKGDFCLVCGKSGSGKSTLLRLLKKEIAPFGSLEGGLEISAAQIGFVNQNVENNIVTETVQGELAFPLQNTDMPK